MCYPEEVQSLNGVIVIPALPILERGFVHHGRKTLELPFDFIIPHSGQEEGMMVKGRMHVR